MHETKDLIGLLEKVKALNTSHVSVAQECIGKTVSRCTIAASISPSYYPSSALLMKTLNYTTWFIIDTPNDGALKRV